MNLGVYLTRSSSYWPSREALVCGERRLTFEELDQQTNRLAGALARRGVATGQAVATFAANCAELVEVELALCKAGLLRVPINARLAPDEVAHIVADADVQVLFVDSARYEQAEEVIRDLGRRCLLVGLDGGALSYPDLVAEGDDRFEAVEVDGDDPAVLNFTSGSTGVLKAAVQTYGNRLANMRKRLIVAGGSGSSVERYLVAGPVTHASGMGVLACLSRGATVVVLPRFDAGAFLQTIEEERVTSSFLVPTMLNMVLAHPDLRRRDLSSLQNLTVGGAPISPQRLREAVGVFGPIISQGYGLGETTSGVTVLTAAEVAGALSEDPDRLLSCGRAIYDTEVRIVDDEDRPVPAGTVGEVVVRGPDCVREYWHEPELSAATFRDGWVHTGDLGYLRADGYLFLVDRKKDMIISGGFNIYSSEVEAVLYEHPAVGEACVVGVPDDEWGEAVKAVLVLRPGSITTAEDLMDFCADRLARMKKPKSVDFVDALPVNRNGKIDRRSVRARYWADEQRLVH